MRVSKDSGAGSQQCGASEPLDKALCCGSVSVHIPGSRLDHSCPDLGLQVRNESAAGARQAGKHSRAGCVGSWSRLPVQGQVWEPPDLVFRSAATACIQRLPGYHLLSAVRRPGEELEAATVGQQGP